MSTPYVDHLDNPVWPLDGKGPLHGGPDEPVVPVWKRKGQIHRAFRRANRILGSATDWSGEIVFELSDPPGNEGWRR